MEACGEVLQKYVALTTAVTLECKHFAWSRDAEVVNACNRLHERLMKERAACGKYFILALDGCNEGKKGESK